MIDPGQYFGVLYGIEPKKRIPVKFINTPHTVIIMEHPYVARRRHVYFVTPVGEKPF